MTFLNTQQLSNPTPTPTSTIRKWRKEGKKVIRRFVSEPYVNVDDEELAEMQRK
ncbi:hypothetical protein M422DRAFT_238747 [Sphaerobolus stellatus SS14]|nr:hypothetical protein M422DRAFT_238747 [Sphaerobolus stellatus SS14]